MKSIRTLLAALVIAALAVSAPAGQTPQEPAFRAGTAVVTVDVVVRDGSGRPVTHLPADQFEVFEDGVPQAVTSFRAPVGAGRPAAARDRSARSSAASAVEAGASGPTMVAVVFDRLSNQGRAMAYEAALNFLGTDETLSHNTGVFYLDMRLEELQDFTRDRIRVARGVEMAARRAPWQFGLRQSPLDGFEGDAEEALLRGTPLNTAGLGRQGPQSNFAQVDGRQGEFFQVERDQLGFRTMEHLRQIVSTLARVPGRKSVVLFSEGLPLTVNTQPRYQSLLDEANRANVAFYAIDAAGLRAVSTNRMTALEARDIGDRAGFGSLADVPGMGTQRLEEAVDATMWDPASSLGRLAFETGGFAVFHTNDLEEGFRRIGEDLASHYVLTYTPTNAEYDGKYRRINVRVKEDGVRVVARRGYVATPPTEGTPVYSFEMPALAALDATPVPNDFPHAMRVVRFPAAADRARVAVVVEAAAQHLAYASSGDAEQFSAECLVLARVLNLRGEVVAKGSELYTLAGPMANAERSQQGKLLFFRAPELPPGAYTVETIVHDTQSGRSSVRVANVDVAAAPPGVPHVSDVFLVAEGEPATEGSDASHPLRFGSLLLYPHLAGPVSRVGRSELAFGFTVHDPVTIREARLELLRGGQPVGVVPLTLDKPGNDGMLRQLVRLPIETFEPGSYELRVLLQASRGAVTRSTRFVVE